MQKISYVYPSMSQPDGASRGGLLSRHEQASSLGCRYIEIPANFIKNPREEITTGVGMCKMLTPEAINTLYTSGDHIPDTVEYILHTEPSFPQKNAKNVQTAAADLRWHDPIWVEKFGTMLIKISERLGKPAGIIEIHPGSNKSVTVKDIASSMKALRDMYGDYFTTALPQIVLENRNYSIVETGQDLHDLWMAMNESVPEICDTCGIVLDFSALFNVARIKKESYEEYLDIVPADGIKGIHIHTKHHEPSIEDDIPWDATFRKVRNIPHDFFINPEIHHTHHVQHTIDFCTRMMND